MVTLYHSCSCYQLLYSNVVNQSSMQHSDDSLPHVLELVEDAGGDVLNVDLGARLLEPLHGDGGRELAGKQRAQRVQCRHFVGQQCTFRFVTKQQKHQSCNSTLHNTRHRFVFCASVRRTVETLHYDHKPTLTFRQNRHIVIASLFELLRFKDRSQISRHVCQMCDNSICQRCRSKACAISIEHKF